VQRYSGYITVSGHEKFKNGKRMSSKKERSDTS